MIADFLFLIHAVSGCTVSVHPFLCGRLTRWQDAPSHRKLMRRYDFFKRYILNLTNLPIRQSGDCTDHRARYARGLVDQFAHSTIWGLYRPPSTICSGTGRPVRLLDNLGTVPATEHDMLGDWSTSSPTRQSGDCTDHRA